jgi:hypothetical protein
MLERPRPGFGWRPCGLQAMILAELASGISMNRHENNYLCTILRRAIARWTSAAKEAVVVSRPARRARLSTAAAFLRRSNGDDQMTKTNTPKAQPAAKTKAKAAPVAKPANEPKGKLAALTGLLLRPQGATLAAMQEATGWQAHSVRGAISGSLKKKLGLDVTSEKVEGVRTYRIVKGAAG